MKTTRGEIINIHKSLFGTIHGFLWRYQERNGKRKRTQPAELHEDNFSQSKLIIFPVVWNLPERLSEDSKKVSATYFE
jgi:hypothetical protein